MTLAILVEIVAIFMAVAGCIAASEVGGHGTGEAKKENAIASITKELTDEGGITLKNKYVLKALPMVLPYLIDVLVLIGNKTGFLDKLNKQ